MKNAGQRWAFSVVTDATLFGLLYAATQMGSEPAHLVFKIVLWPLAVLGILGGVFISSDDLNKELPDRSISFVLWNYATTAVLVIWTALSGMPELAGCYFLAVIFMESKRVVEP